MPWLYAKEPFLCDSSFDHLKQIFKLMDKKIFTINYSLIFVCLFIWTYDLLTKTFLVKTYFIQINLYMVNTN